MCIVCDHFSVDIMVVQEMKVIEQILQLKFSLRLTWVDARLDFFNIKIDETMNVVSLDELNRIWLPVIILIVSFSFSLVIRKVD